MQDYWQGNEGFRDGAGGKLIQNLLLRYNTRSQAITVGLTAVTLPTSILTKRRLLIIHNNSDNTIFIGASDVTAASGFPILPRQGFTLSVADDVPVYAISDVAGNNIRIMEGA